MTYDAIIVGGGVAGLTAAAYLTKAGRSVLLIEKQEKCGGLVNSFERNGFIYDGGIRATENAGALFPMLKRLGLDLEFVKNKVSMGIEGNVIRVLDQSAVDDYGKLLGDFFPESRADISAIIEDIRKIMGYMGVQYGIDNPLFLDIKEDRAYFLREVFPWMFKYIKTVGKIMALNQPVEEYLKGFTQNPALLDIISQHFFTATPAFFALSYISLYLDYYYPKGGTGNLISQLVDFIQSHGGEIKTNTEITKIDLEGRMVADQAGHIFAYNQLLWAADQKSLYRNAVANPDTAKKTSDAIIEMRERLSQLKGNNSVFTIFAASNLPPRFFSDIATEHFFYTPVAKGQSQAGPLPLEGNWAEISSWLEEFLGLTTYEISIPVLRDASLAPEGKTGLVISLLFDYRLTRRIREIRRYEDFKQFMEARIPTILDDCIYPGLDTSLIERFSSSPLTMETLTNNTDGAITGWAFTNDFIPSENRLARIANSVNTPLPNVLQAGQWTFSPSGFPISLISGKLAADKINKRLGKKKSA
jgi:phytoene dehydrogenase-like protein